nr:hypothetical protein [uncultured Carboxylicivirga sp.]
MITEQKIKIFRKYHGDIDGFSRGGRKYEKDLFENADWLLIDNVLQDLELIKKGLCSTDYRNRLEKILNENFENKAIEILEK